MNSKDIGELFLIDFTQRIISTIPPSEKITEYQKIDAPPLTKVSGLNGARFLDARSVPHTKVGGFQTLRHEDETLHPSILKPEIQEDTPQMHMVPELLKTIQIKRHVPIITNRPIEMTQVPKITNQVRNKSLNLDLRINPKFQTEKLSDLLKDPSINEIECTGADKHLLIKRGGMVQKTRLQLSIEDIYGLIAEFSQKTRIPVINGTIKAALDNLIITATLSGTTGPRFIIKKKSLFHKLI